MESCPCNNCPPWGPPGVDGKDGERGESGPQGCKGERGKRGPSVIVKSLLDITEQEEDYVAYPIPCKTKAIEIYAVGGGGSGSANNGIITPGGGAAGYLELYVNLKAYPKCHFTHVVIKLGKGGASVPFDQVLDGNSGTETIIKLVGLSNIVIGAAYGGNGSLTNGQPGSGGTAQVFIDDGINGFIIPGDNADYSSNMGGLGASSRLGNGGFTGISGVYGSGGGGSIMNINSGTGGDGRVIIKYLY